ncbi:MAG: class I SAM-dependent methyltransferase [Oscillospiraceae bacterium]|nr:class I SAM-dependent methyltransferase [Oscillospiraceae bacterium]
MSHIYDNDGFFEAYAGMARSRDGLSAAGEWHQLQPLFPDVRGKSVLDLGCGYGWHCKYAVQMGAARVLGIDASRKMIARAKEINADEKIRYEVCGLEEYDYPEDTCDLVISNLVLHYIEDLEEVYRKVRRTLKKGGCFLFNIEHPVFTAGIREDWIYDENGEPLYWPVDNYYYPGERVTAFLGKMVAKQHHTLTQVLNPLPRNGFAIEAVEEAQPPGEMLSIPGMRDEMRRPMMLLVKAKKL